MSFDEAVRAVLVSQPSPEQRRAELIARWRPVRETLRPKECRGAAPCWVEEPYLATNGRTAMICATCHGRIGKPRGARSRQ